MSTTGKHQANTTPSEQPTAPPIIAGNGINSAAPLDQALAANVSEQTDAQADAATNGQEQEDAVKAAQEGQQAQDLTPWQSPMDIGDVNNQAISGHDQLEQQPIN